MPLTAEDVKNKQFTPTRFKGGYDEKEVDDFLDEIEAELTRCHRENADLRARLQVAEQSARQAAQASVAAHPGTPSAPPPAAAPTPPPPAAAATAAVAGGEAGQEAAALRMLAMAQKTADGTIAEARRDADKLLAEARTRAEQLERETQERHRNVVGSLDAERDRLERAVEGLRSFEREYRARLKSYLEGQLRDLEGRGDGVAPRPAAGAAAGSAQAAAPGSTPGLAPSGVPGGASGESRGTSQPGGSQPGGSGQPGAPGGSATPGAAPRAEGGSEVPGLAPPGRPSSPFSPVSAPPVPGVSSGAPSSGDGPSGPPREAPAGGFEVDEGPEVPPARG